MRIKIIQAVGEPSRLFVVILIALQAMTPNAFTRNLEISQQCFSNHLHILDRCGFVKQEQKDKYVDCLFEIDKKRNCGCHNIKNIVGSTLSIGQCTINKKKYKK